MGSQERTKSGAKPKRVTVEEGGEVLASSHGKNAWDVAIRDFVTKILDISVVDWSKQAPNAITKLRDALDNKFKYLSYPMSMAGFRNSIIKYLKSKRCHLKMKWLNGEEKCPMHVNEKQWSKLIVYWKTEAQQLKSPKMVAAR